MKKTILLILSHTLVALLAMAAAFGIVIWQGAGMTKLEQLEALIQECYIDDVDLTKVEDAAADAMIANLGDRWSYYIPAREYGTYVEQSENAYVGIGVTIQPAQDGSGLEILSVEKGGSAMEAGIQPGDIIVAIEGQSAAGMETTVARDLVRGKEGTKVNLTIRRQEETLELQVLRKVIETIVAEGIMLEDQVGLVTIYNFDARCASETIGAIEDLLNQGAEKILFDVRYNPGGYAHELVALLDYLLPEGELFRSVSYTGEEKVDMSDENYLDVPMAVLVNQDTYSAAEFFGAALQEYDAAVVVGTRTSGKGYYQQTFSLLDGSAVALSTGKYVTPQGISLEGVGIQPDVEVPVDEDTEIKIYYGQLTPEEDPQIQAALEAMKEG